MRIVKHAIGGLCLLAALLLVVLWVRSYWATDWIGHAWHADDGEYVAINIQYCQSARGQFSWGHNVRGIHYRYFDPLFESEQDAERVRAELKAVGSRFPSSERPLSYRRLPARDPRPEQPWHGFERTTRGSLPSSQSRIPHDQSHSTRDSLSLNPATVVWSRMIAIPIWLPALLLAIPSGLWLRGLLRRRLAPHACPACGYDLRASPERCPECGRSITPPEEAGGATDFTDSEE